ncbi:hypothetical protein R6Z07F_006331 [Ovis aries]
MFEASGIRHLKQLVYHRGNLSFPGSQGLGSRGFLGNPYLAGFCENEMTLENSLLWQRGMTRAAPGSCRHLYTSSWRADCNRASLTRVHRQTYARLYPILLVKQDGSTIHIRYPEPRRMLKMPLDLDSLSPEERRARFRKREGQLKEKEEEPELGDDFDVEQYKQFWSKK